LQLVHNYPEYKKHRQLHENFKVTVDGLVQQFKENGFSLELSNKINNFLVGWLLNHLEKEDKKIGEYIQSQTAIDQ